MKYLILILLFIISFRSAVGYARFNLTSKNIIGFVGVTLQIVISVAMMLFIVLR